MTDDIQIYKIVIIGDSGTGKTNIARRFINNHFMETIKPTTSIQFLSKTIQIKDSKVKITIWDTAGQERFRHLSKLYYKNAVGVIIVYDITEPQSYESIPIWLNSVNDILDPQQFRMIIIGNKSDLSSIRRIPLETVKLWYQNKRGIDCFETSAKTNEGIKESLTFLIEKIYAMVNVEHLNKNKQIELSDSYVESDDEDRISQPELNQKRNNNNQKQMKASQKISILSNLKSKIEKEQTMIPRIVQFPNMHSKQIQKNKLPNESINLVNAEKQSFLGKKNIKNQNSILKSENKVIRLSVNNYQKAPSIIKIEKNKMDNGQLQEQQEQFQVQDLKVQQTNFQQIHKKKRCC